MSCHQYATAILEEISSIEKRISIIQDFARAEKIDLELDLEDILLLLLHKKRMHLNSSPQEEKTNVRRRPSSIANTP